MKVAFVHNACPAYRWPLFEALARRHNTHFIFTGRHSTPEALDASFVPSVRVPEMSDFELTWGLGRLLREDSYELYVANDLGYYSTYVTAWIAARARKPFVLWNGQWAEVAHPRRWLLKGLENQIVRRARAAITYGSKARAFMVKRGMPESSIFVAYNTSELQPSCLSPGARLDFLRSEGLPQGPVVLALGRLLAFKGFDYLLRAWELVERETSNASLIVAGSGPELHRLRGLACQLKLTRARLTGRHAGVREKTQLYGVADLFVLPSVYRRSNEPWGLVLNEAALNSLPLVATDQVGAAYDLISPGVNGFRVPQKNPGALAEALLDIIGAPQRWSDMGSASRNLVLRTCGYDQMVRAFESAFEEALRE